MCDWLKGLFGKKCNCKENGCCESKKTEEKNVLDDAVTSKSEEDKKETTV